MAVDRDPLFLACFNANHEGYVDDPDFPLTDSNGNLMLRSGESIITEFTGKFNMIRYPEQRWLIDPDKIGGWRIILTTDRIVGIHKVLFPGAFEFFDFIDEFGKFAGLHPTEEIPIDQFFHWLGTGDKILNKFSLIFQIALTRISMISCIKTMTSEINGLEFWYEDGPNKSQTLIQIFPDTLKGKAIFDLGVKVQEASLKEKERCLIKKHELDPNWEIENYNTYLMSIQRLVRAPDFLAMGSGTLDSDSFDPISFQPHPIIWYNEVFYRSMTGEEPIRIVDLKY